MSRELRFRSLLAIARRFACVLLLSASVLLTPMPYTAVATATDPGSAAPVRVVLPGRGIDLPVLPSDVDVEGNQARYPLCDVAQWWNRYDVPGKPGTTWIYAHARAGMFLPLLEESQRDDGAALVGADVRVHTADAKVYTYRIFTVRRHATDQSLARDLEPGEQRLVLQTSEGPTGTVPKLHVGARLTGTADEVPGVTPPTANPRPCYIAGDTNRTSRLVVVLAAGLFAAGLIVLVVLRSWPSPPSGRPDAAR